ncbi:MAG TPA: hypothetical protein VFE62_01885 [Gemmataceae bacterium]|nr:hypothetical protein [Gemmataceae bacterium]
MMFKAVGVSSVDGFMQCVTVGRIVEDDLDDVRRDAPLRRGRGGARPEIVSARQADDERRPLVYRRGFSRRRRRRRGRLGAIAGGKTLLVHS